MSYHNKGTLFRGGKVSRDRSDFQGKVDLFDDFRFPNKRATERWIIIAAICLLVTSIFLGIFYFRAYRHAAVLKAKCALGEKEIHQLQLTMKGASIDRPPAFKKRDFSDNTEINSMRKRYESQLTFLADVSRVIPPGTWLKRLVCKNKGGRKKVKDVVSVEGYASTYQEVMAFYTNLARLEQLHGCCLRYDQDGDKLKFSISADCR